MTVICFSCRKQHSLLGNLGFRANCDCGADLHVCKNCEFYDPKVYNECRETSADVVREKERANFCEYFQPGTSVDAAKKKEDLLAAANALFKKGGS
jgi:hypothetical protein